MKNYRDSDYAVNKFAAGIVYRFANETLEVTLEAYLAENPDKTEQDFLELKMLSDEMYLEVDRKDNAQSNKMIPIQYADSLCDSTAGFLEEQFFEIQELRYTASTIRHLLKNNILTETQRRRFILHFIKGASLRRIANYEGCSHVAVGKSLRQAVKKIKKYLSG